MPSSPLESHVVVFPFMAQGHTLPLLDLSKALSRRQIKVTVVTTPRNANFISNYITRDHPLISLNEIPFPGIGGLPEGCENTSQLPTMDLHIAFVRATKQLRPPFEKFLKSMMQTKTPPLCVISDFFLGWTLNVCQELGIPRLVFHGMGILSMAICKYACVHAPHLKSASVFDPLELPGVKLPFALTSQDLPDEVLNAHDPCAPSNCLAEVAFADDNSWGVIVNSFEELEKAHIPSFESFYANGAKAWCVGPLYLYNEMEHGDNNKSTNQQKDDDSSTVMQWLAKQVTADSVIYVCFGTQADVSNAQLDEIAFGLVESDVPFLWVVRSDTWSLPSSLNMKGKGLITRDWVNQRQVLSHRAVGGFLSHCGWNSALEGLSAGVPILAMPMMAEQALNAKLIVHGLGAGLGVKRAQDSGPENAVTRGAICAGVKELMEGETRWNIKERAQALGREARRAVQEGGSSHGALIELIAQLRARRCSEVKEEC